ncbi:hypothetical protein [Deinococcus hopiensis]|uniref:hypothetical protein n=1 Tax=Deinococcus hopiensis TaxID=309885 RepID=UPI001BB08C6C|nr:hypothetical protein [Deinococcus hopiensis]
MIPLRDLLLFILAAFVLVLTPGPNMIYLIPRSTVQGCGAGLLSLAGVRWPELSCRPGADPLAPHLFLRTPADLPQRSALLAQADVPTRSSGGHGPRSAVRPAPPALHPERWHHERPPP